MSEIKTGKKLEKIECKLCGRYISTNNIKSHLNGNRCKKVRV